MTVDGGKGGTNTSQTGGTQTRHKCDDDNTHEGTEMLTSKRYDVTPPRVTYNDVTELSVMTLPPEESKCRDNNPCSECLAYELQVQHLLPTYENHRAFLTPQWRMVPQLGYVCYRVLVACLICVWVAVDFFKEGAKFYSENMSYWLIFATNWGFLLLALSAVLRALAAICHYIHTRRKECPAEPAGIALMALWVMYTTAANVALVVTLAYWTFLTTIDLNAIGFMNTPMCILKHTLNSCYILCDLLLCAMPIRLLHMVYPMLVGAIYVTFNALYFTNGGLGPNDMTYTYHVMDWQKPGTSVMSATLGFVITAFAQCALYGVYRLRIYLSNLYEAHKTRTKHFDDIETVKGCVELDQKENDTMLPVVLAEESEENDSIFPPIQERSFSHEALNIDRQIASSSRGHSDCYVALQQTEMPGHVTIVTETHS